MQKEPSLESSLPLDLADTSASGSTQNSTRESTSSRGPRSWTEAEIRVFILFHEKDDKWPCHKRSMLGLKVSYKFGVKLHLRSGRHLIDKHYAFVFTAIVESACRYKVVAWLRPKY